jgi:hypothetical protein
MRRTTWEAVLAWSTRYLAVAKISVDMTKNYIASLPRALDHRSASNVTYTSTISNGKVARRVYRILNQCEENSKIFLE